MLKAKFRSDMIPRDLRPYVKEGTLYPVLDQSDIVFVKVDLGLIPFRAEQVERTGEIKPDAILELRTAEEFISPLLRYFETGDPLDV